MKIYTDETAEFRKVVAKLKAKGMNVTQIAASMQVHHNTVAAWHCGSVRINPARLEQAKGLL